MYERRGPKLGLILIIVVIVLLIGGTAVFVLTFLNVGGSAGQTGDQANNPPPEAPSPTTVQIIVAAHDIRRGARLAEEDVTTMAWPVMPDAPVPPGAFTVGESPDQPGLEQVNGQVARVDILQNQPVLANMITSIDQPVQLAAAGSDAALLIPAGKIAIAFPISRLTSVAYELRAGDHVDILMSYRFVDLDKDFQTKLPNGVVSFDGGTGFTQSPNPSDALGIDTQGREDDGPFGLRILVIPSEIDQRPRQATQLMIGNAEVLHMGQSNLQDTVAAPAATPEPSGDVTATPEPAAAEEESAPPPVPDIITLIMSRQDALVLKYSLEVGADIDLVMRSAYDSDVQSVETETVTLQYLFDFYHLAEPPKLPIGFDPSIDVVVNPVGNFQQPLVPAPTPEP